MNYDFAYIALLLEVAKETLAFPQLKPLHDAALAELTAIVHPPAEEAVEEEPAEEPEEEETADA